MKLRIINFNAIVLLLFIFSSCKREAPDDQVIYLKDAQTTNAANLNIDQDPVTYTITAGTSQTVAENIDLSYTVSETSLNEFNKKNNTEYKLLPKALYSLSAEKTTVVKGTAVSIPVSVLVNPLPADLPVTDQYAIPVTINSVSGGFNILDASKTIVLIIKRTLTVSVPYLRGNQSMSGNFKTPFTNITNWTIEWRVNMDGLDANNQALISTGDLYTRFGDVVIRPTQLQVKTAGTQFSPANDFMANKWYNFALTYDGANLKWYESGKEIMNQSVQISSEFSSMYFGGGGGGVGTSKPRKVNEIRFWTVTRTPSQLANNLYAVDSTTAGLAGYWKCNEATGNLIRDCSPNKNDMLITPTTVQWLHNVKMPATD